MVFLNYLFLDKKNFNPSPWQYNINERQVTSHRFENTTFGKDIKETLKEIKQSPGPADYRTEDHRVLSLAERTEKRAPRNSMIQIRPASRDWSFAVPLSGDPFSPFGALKTASRMMRQKRIKIQASHFI